MPKIEAEMRIKNVQANADRLWDSEAKHWNAEADKYNKESGRAGVSPAAKKTAQERADHAVECVEYCRRKIGQR